MTITHFDTVFDPARYKDEQRATWNALSTGWLSVLDTFERGAATVTARLLELGGVGEGSRVLDVGTGIGEPALTAARVAGPDGRVVGVDLAPEMIELARQRMAGAGLANAEFLVGDVESLDLPPEAFDVVLSRWGLMFAPDRLAAFRSLLRVLRSSGVLAFASWGRPDTAPLMMVGFQVFARLLDLPQPPPGTPCPFTLSDPDRVRDELESAGFTGVTVNEVQVPFLFDSEQAYVEFNKAVTPPWIRELLRTRFGSDRDPRIWDEVRMAADAYRTTAGGIFMPSAALCVSATKPAG
jgi:enediyne biosynthesis protein CalE5